MTSIMESQFNVNMQHFGKLTGQLFGACYEQDDAVLISNFRRVQNVVCFLLCDSPASEIYMQTFRNTLSVPSS